MDVGIAAAQRFEQMARLIGKRQGRVDKRLGQRKPEIERRERTRFVQALEKPIALGEQRRAATTRCDERRRVRQHSQSGRLGPGQLRR